MKRSLPLFLAVARIAFPQTAVLNLSHDLTTLGIAKQDMAPNMPALDARPLFEAGVQYAQAQSIPLITCDTGTYYFLSGHPFGVYAFFNGLHDVTVDLAGSDLFFSLATWMGLECNNCRNVQFQNFTIDSLQLPFTQVRVTSVDMATNRINYTVLPGWEPATNFNTPRNPLGVTNEPLYAFDFRNSAPVRGTSRMAIKKPVDPAFLTITSSAPWEDPKQLANIQPGDVIALTARVGSPAVRFADGSNIGIRNVAIYSSGVVGLQVNASPNSTIEQVQIIPRPGTDRLVSTNADGISLIQLGQNNVIRRCRVKRTGDDGLSPNSQELAVVTGQTGARQVMVTRSAYSTFANGLQVQFIDNTTGFPAVTAHITAQVPPYSTALPPLNEAVTLTLDQDIPKLGAGVPMVYADPAFRGSGLLIENNLVEDLLFARGISLWGIIGGTVRGNVIRNPAWSAINPVQHLSVRDWMDGPTQNLDIERNVMEQFNTAFATGKGASLAGVDIESDDLNLALLASGSPSQNITIHDNFLSASPYSGIRVQNVSGGSVTGNLLMNVSAQPTANNPPAALQLGQPIVIAASANISSTSNTIDTQTSSISVTSAASFADDAIAPDSLAAIGTRLAVDAVTITDSAGIAYTATLEPGLPGQVVFLVPYDCAPGAAVVTASSAGATVGKGGVLIDSLAPALFSADGSGSGSALGMAVLTAGADGSQTTAPLTQPVDLGQPGDVVNLLFYGTGLRNLDVSDTVTVNIAGQMLPVQSVGAEGTTDGLDVVSVIVPAQLRGAGQLSLRVVVDGLSSNIVQVNIQ
jgi:uncharacterized protein (TIGR03437 family)